jgi:hypothetical protein
MKSLFILVVLIVAAMTAVTVLNGKAAPQAIAQAINDIQITTSDTKMCAGAINVKSFVVYAANTNAGKFIDVTIKYDSNPSGQSFPLYDADATPYTDQFPKLMVVRIAPQRTVQIGCTYTYRSSNTGHEVTKVPIVTTAASATYVIGGQDKPSEDARSFVAFVWGIGYHGCPSGTKPQGEFALINLHPYARLRARVELAGGHGMEDVPPFGSSTDLGCTNGESRVTGVSQAELVYPPTHP